MAKRKRKRAARRKAGPAVLSKTGVVTKRYRSAGAAAKALRKVCTYDPNAVVHQGRKVVAACGVGMAGARRRKRSK